MTSLHVICGLGLPNKNFWLPLYIGDCLKNFFEDLLFVLDSTCGCVLGPWPRAFLSLASRGSVLGKAVLGLSLGFFFVSWASDFFCVLGLEPCILDSSSGKLRRFQNFGSIYSKSAESLKFEKSYAQKLANCRMTSYVHKQSAIQKQILCNQ